VSPAGSALKAVTLNAILLAATLWTASQPAWAQTPPSEVRSLRPEMEKFIDQMVQAHGFDAKALRKVFAKVQTSQGVTRAIAAPSTSKPWYEFKPLFVDAQRITGGVKYWNDNAELLERARKEFGVPEAIIVSVIGIETRYGKRTGNFRVMDALSTLAFDVPARADYFRRELEQFLLLAREQQWDPLSINGSFAGAMGMPQFMPTSYRRYAIDFNADGHTDLWNDPADIIGSIGSYLHQSGWKEGTPIVAPARVDTAEWKPLVDLGLKPTLTLDQWKMRGVDTLSNVQASLAASLFTLDLLGGPEFWFGFENFYAILQYNRSRNYAMAVHELANEIVRERERIAAGVGSNSAQ
jgi:membrane-bound lytic murein transglycosylase B